MPHLGNKFTNGRDPEDLLVIGAGYTRENTAPLEFVDETEIAYTLVLKAMFEDQAMPQKFILNL